jgi:hypothetical protein
MAQNYPRVGVYLPPNTKKALLLMKSEVFKKTGKRVPLNKLIVGILDEFLERSCFSRELSLHEDNPKKSS